jgi:hypothetical protein
MSQHDLHETLTAFLQAFDVPPEAGIAIDSAELEVPLQVRVIEDNGELRVCAQPPDSIYHSGFESLVHRTRMTAGSIELDDVELTNAWPGVQEDSHDSGR